jgi:hypothetical protein
MIAQWLKTNERGIDMSLQEALDKTDPMKSKTVTQGSVDEEAAIERFKDFLNPWTEENILSKVRLVYAENAYYNDALKEVIGIDAIEAYFRRGFKTLESCTFDFFDVAISGGDYYLRWVTDMRYKTFKKGRAFRSYGITHIRFDERGKVVLHVDYWDSASGIFEHIPLLGGLIRFIKGRL